MMRSQPSFKPGKHAFTFLAVICGKRKTGSGSLFVNLNAKNQVASALSVTDKALRNVDVFEQEHLRETIGSRPVSEFSDLVTAGQLEVQFLESPNEEELRQALETLEPEIVYFQGKQVPGTDEIGPLELSNCQVSSLDVLTSFFTSKAPELVYLETSDGSKLGEALHDKGVPYVILWKSSITYPFAVHFRQALVAVLQSSSAIQVWSAFQLANSSFQLYCDRLKTRGGANGHQRSINMGPIILGDPPPTLIEPLKAKNSEEGDSSPITSASLKIYDEETELPLLVCADPCAQDDFAFKALEDGLNALLTVEVQGMRLLHRVSAPPPVATAPTLDRGVVTMRCDLCSASFARISLLVSGSAQTCFDDQMLEYCLKKELAQKGQLVSSILAAGDRKPLTPELRRSAAVACGAAVVEIRFMTSTWVTQVLRQLAPDNSFHSLVALGIAGIHGFPVAGFEKEEADCLLSVRSNIDRKHDALSYAQVHSSFSGQIPSWLVPPLPSRKRRKISSPRSLSLNDTIRYDEDANSLRNLNSEGAGPVAHHQATVASSSSSVFSLVAAMKPVHHANQNNKMPFAGAVLSGAQNNWSTKVSLSNGPPGKAVRPNICTDPLPPNPGSGPPVGHNRQTLKVPSPAQLLSLKIMPMKKHGCNRRPIHECSEEEFLKDVRQFLISRGHNRFVPSGGIESFPDAILNGKRLDLYNLYREVVSRGGFHVGNGINWKGQVFSKMRNHTLVNRMTGVGNTLKKHYETYLLEYELAHDDVDGECCILCHSSAAGDWVNCGICGEWAHFGCDRRIGLGAFKDYAKTDGLEYICPRCSATNVRGVAGRKKVKNPMEVYP